MYSPINKCFYIEHTRVEQRSWDDIDRFLNLHQIKFSGFDVPKPIFSLDEINFPDYITDELKMQGIHKPSAIQSLTWPALYNGRDIMCIGLPTHSRVLSYICPALVFIKQQEYDVRRKGPLVLIATQTKEVAKEILTHSQMFMHQAQCTFCCLFDDENINTQALQLNQLDPDIIIGNYHRLCELLDLNLINLKNISYLVMDDFYRNRSARLSDEIKRVVNETRTDRQTAIYSRIVPSGLQKSNGDEFQNDAIFVCIGNDDIRISNRDLFQSIQVCTMAEKKKKLQDIITEISEKESNFKILVYANGFKKIRITEKIIKELGIDTFAYERTNVGRRRRAMKEKVYYNFNATPNSVLVASDVVSSKVELPDLNYIINADFPINLSLYLNRMRSGIKKYISIFIAEDARHADRLIYVLNESGQEIPPILYKISEAYVNSGKDVDRMPSLQEISDGLTKPVEKPIPKPLPPTVHLNTNNITTAKRPLEEKLKQLQPLNGSYKNNINNSSSSSSNNYSNKKFKHYNQHQNYGNQKSSNYNSHTTFSSQNTYNVLASQQNINTKFYFNSTNNYQLTQNIIKLEPTEAYHQPTHYIPPQSPTTIPPSPSTPYFQMQFKQEPVEYSQNYTVPQSQPQQQQEQSATLVNHLLKDKQVLNLLDKVAQTFRSPTQSMYQGSWNFQ